MKKKLIILLKFFLKIIYFFMKLLPTNNKKVVFISRQSDKITLDFQMISDKLIEDIPNIKVVFICDRLKNNLLGYIKYIFITLKQMYHLATSKVCVIDSYCIPVCILKHKKTLTILQMWHSIGKIKKSGYQTLDSKSGRSKEIARLLCMHKNYTNIIAGGTAFNKFYVEGFNCNKDIILNYGLPRIDYLISKEKELKDKIYKIYPKLKNKKVIYYTPTFRTYEVNGIDNLIKEYKKYKKDYILIVREHPNQKIEIKDKDVMRCYEFSSVDLLSIADYVITDYSSISLEAAILNKKILFYLYDYDRYMNDNGINLDFSKVLPSCSSKSIKELFDIIINDKYDDISYQKFRKKYLPEELGNSTLKIKNYIIEKLNR